MEREVIIDIINLMKIQKLVNKIYLCVINENINIKLV